MVYLSNNALLLREWNEINEEIEDILPIFRLKSRFPNGFVLAHINPIAMKKLLFFASCTFFFVAAHAQIKSLPLSQPTEINFQFLQGNAPLSVKGLVFQFRLLDSTGCALAVFQSPTDIELVSDNKIKVLLNDERVAHLPPKAYKYELVDVKGNTERLWQKGTFNIKNNVGAASSVVSQQNDRVLKPDDGPFISLLRKEVDPTVPAHVKAISTQQIEKWDKNTTPTVTETDPTVAVHVKAITTTQIANWDQAAKNTTAPVGGSAVVYQSDYANNLLIFMALRVGITSYLHKNRFYQLCLQPNN